MSKEVVGTDGTVYEFPDDATTEEMSALSSAPPAASVPVPARGPSPLTRAPLIPTMPSGPTIGQGAGMLPAAGGLVGARLGAMGAGAGTALGELARQKIMGEPTSIGPAAAGGVVSGLTAGAGGALMKAGGALAKNPALRKAAGNVFMRRTGLKGVAKDFRSVRDAARPAPAATSAKAPRQSAAPKPKPAQTAAPKAKPAQSAAPKAKPAVTVKPRATSAASSTPKAPSKARKAPSAPSETMTQRAARPPNTKPPESIAGERYVRTLSPIAERAAARFEARMAAQGMGAEARVPLKVQGRPGATRAASQRGAPRRILEQRTPRSMRDPAEVVRSTTVGGIDDIASQMQEMEAMSAELAARGILPTQRMKMLSAYGTELMRRAQP